MKRLPAILCLALAVLFCFSATAETVARVHNVDMESVLSDCTLNVGFATDAITDKEIYANVYDTVTYDIADIASLKPGDVLETVDGDITVESVNTGDGWVDINGGMDENGVTLRSSENSNCYYQVEYELPSMLMIGQGQLRFADKVTLNVYKMDEDLSIIGEGYDTEELSGTELHARLAALGEKLGGEFAPESTSVRLADEGIIAEITIDYIP